MKRNVGSTDRIIRVILAILIGYFAYSTDFEKSWIPIAMYVVAAVLLLTALSGICCAYSVVGANTCKTKE
jgi:hypothetical protein